MRKKLTDSQKKYVEKVADKTGWSFKKVSQAMSQAKEKHGLSFSDYVSYKIYELSEKEIEARAAEIKEEKQKIKDQKVNAVMEATGWDYDKAYNSYRKAFKEYGIRHADYMKYRFFEIPDSQYPEKLAQIKEHKEAVKAKKEARIQKKQVIISRIAEQTRKSEEEIREHMDFCNKEYGILPYDYEQLRAWTLSNEELIPYAKPDRTGAAERNSIKFRNKLQFVTGWSDEEVINETNRIKEKFGIGPKRFYEGQYYLLNDDEIAAKLQTIAESHEASIQKIMDGSGWDREKVESHLKYVKRYYKVGMADFILMHGWEMSQHDLETLSTQVQCQAITNKYNTPDGHSLARNKVAFDKAFKDFIQRKFWINDSNATYESFLEFIDGLDYIFSKPINLQMGKGAEKIKISEHDPKELYDSFMSRPMVLVEECVKQCRELNELYDNSVNTVRMVTINIEGDCRIISAFFRAGANGSVVDNMVSGGLLAGVDEETGTVVTGAIDRFGVMHDVHPNTGKPIKGMKIPHYDYVKELVLNAIKHDDRLNYVGWDVAICDDKAVIIEGNTYPDLCAYQLPFWREMKKGMKYKYEKYL